jgi:hypothetical protein
MLAHESVAVTVRETYPVPHEQVCGVENAYGTQMHELAIGARQFKYELLAVSCAVVMPYWEAMVAQESVEVNVRET